MRFVTICRAKSTSISRERIERRVGWDYPPGMNILAEYWPVGSEISVILITEGDSPEPMFAAIAAWDDHFDFQIMPVLTAEEGMALAAQMS
jgi:hypothetical protein